MVLVGRGGSGACGASSWVMEWGWVVVVCIGLRKIRVGT